jgi:hypothetical protein
MDVTRKQLTNVEPGKGIGSPMNVMFNDSTFPTADMKQVVRPNFETLYSIVYLDLTKEPMVVSVPDTGGGYYLLPMLDNRHEDTTKNSGRYRAFKEYLAALEAEAEPNPDRKPPKGGLAKRPQSWR